MPALSISEILTLAGILAGFGAAAYQLKVLARAVDAMDRTIHNGITSKLVELQTTINLLPCRDGKACEPLAQETRPKPHRRP